LETTVFLVLSVSGVILEEDVGDDGDGGSNMLRNRPHGEFFAAAVGPRAVAAADAAARVAPPDFFLLNDRDGNDSDDGS
jgi:hypothetical protein